MEKSRMIEAVHQIRGLLYIGVNTTNTRRAGNSWSLHGAFSQVIRNDPDPCNCPSCAGEWGELAQTFIDNDPERVWDRDRGSVLQIFSTLDCVEKALNG